MRRVALVLVVAALMVMGSASHAFAYAYFGNNGKAASAPGQDQAGANCVATSNRQADDGNLSNGHQRAGNPFPTNCDHLWQELNAGAVEAT